MGISIEDIILNFKLVGILIHDLILKWLQAVHRSI